MARWTKCICDRCKKEIRVVDAYTLEVYRPSDDSNLNINMDICPDCFEKLHEGFLGLGEVTYERH